MIIFSNETWITGARFDKKSPAGMIQPFTLGATRTREPTWIFL
jgi:hypothetical protein